VLVGEATRRAASGAIVFEEAGEQLLKGKESPVPAWRATRVRPLEAMAPPQAASSARWVGPVTLAGLAFLTINPLLKPSDVLQRKPDPEVLALNSGIDNALVSLKKPYTVKVATFSGRSVTPLGNSMFASNEERFDAKLAKPRDADSYDLNRAGEDATQLAHALRARQFEAYVYHDRFQSIVTVGGFDSPDDPQIRRIAAQLGAKPGTDPATGNEGMIAEVLTLKLADGRQQAWIFDPQPQLMATPRVR